MISPAGKFSNLILTTILGLASFTAAAASYTNEVDFKVEDSTKIPLSIGYAISDTLKDHTYTEKACNTTFRIKNENLHSELIRSVFLSVAESSTELDPTKPSDVSNLDVIAVIAPGTTPYGWWQSSFPCRTALPFYEAWFKYKITLINTDSSVIATWETTASASAEESEVNNRRSRGITESSSRAFLDMQSKLIDEFSRQPAILELVKQK